MDQVKHYFVIAITIFTLLGALSTYWFYTNQVIKVYNNPEALPEVTEDIIEKGIVEPIEKQVNLIVWIANVISSLPPFLIVMLIFLIAYLKR